MTSGSVPIDPDASAPLSTQSPRQRSQVQWAWGVSAVSALLVLVLLFAGYMVAHAESPSVRAVDSPLDPVTVTGRQGSQPVVTIAQAVTVQSAKVRTEYRGDGREITEDSPVLVALTAFNGSLGENLNPSGAPNIILGAANEDDLGPLLTQILVGSTEGSRIVVARPLENGGTEIDIVDVLYTIAKGEEKEEAEGPLTVTFDDSGPIVKHKKGKAPSGLFLQILNEGTGPQVQLSDAVVVQYLAGTWTDNKIIASTWSDGSPLMINLADSMPGIRDALVDQRVGSRLAVTIPADMATGEDTLFVVVDILGTMPSAHTSAEIDGLQ